MPTKKASASSSQVMDVTHPNKVKPTASSVPIIVTNRPILKDPMVVDEATKPSESTAETAVKKPKKIELKPLNLEALTPAADESTPGEKEVQGAPVLPIEKLAERDTAVADTPEADTDAPEEKPVDETPEPQPTPEAASTSPATPAAPAAPSPEGTPEAAATPAEPATETALDGEAAGDELLPAEKPVDAKAAKEAREAAEKELALEKLIAEGTYVLPVNTVEKRRNETILVVVFIVLVLGIAGFLLALDAGYVHVPGLAAPTNFIKG